MLLKLFVIIDNPTKFASKYKLKSSRLQNWDYSSPGKYFITICTLNKNNFFGKIINSKMELSKMGIITKQCLIDIPKHSSNVFLDEYIVMPNHVHILFHVETPYMASLQPNKSSLQPNKPSLQPKLIFLQTENKYKELNEKSNQSIPKAIQLFKSAVTRQINSKTIFFAWQSRFHDIIIKDEKQYFIIKNYIQNNVINWHKDKFYRYSP